MHLAHPSQGVLNVFICKKNLSDISYKLFFYRAQQNFVRQPNLYLNMHNIF